MVCLTYMLTNLVWYIFFEKFNNYQKKVNVCTMLICCKIRGKMQKAWEKNVAQVRECQR